MSRKLRQLVQRRFIAVDDRQQRAPASGEDRESCRRLHLQRRTEHNENLRLLAPCLGSFHACLPHRLTERNSRGFQKAAARAAHGSGKFFAQMLVNVGRRLRITARKATHEPVGAVKLDDFVIRDARHGVQAIDVLGNQPEQPAASLELHD